MAYRNNQAKQYARTSALDDDADSYLKQLEANGVDTYKFMKNNQDSDLPLFKKRMAAKPTVERMAMSPPPMSDYASEVSKADSYFKTLNMRAMKVSETPQLKHADLNNYLNWQNKERLEYGQNLMLKKSQPNKLSPLRAGGNKSLYEDEERSNISKSAMMVRNKFNASAMASKLRDIQIDGISISSKDYNPRAYSNLRTISYGNKPYLSNGFQSPGPKKKVLDGLPWEERQKLMSFSMAKINSLNKEDILKQITTPLESPSKAIRQNQTTLSNIDDALIKLCKMGDDYKNLKEYSRYLIKRFDQNMDGIISFQELVDGLKSLDINLNLKDRMALMKRLDVNNDNMISDSEIYHALQSVEAKLIKESVNLALRKIASGADELQNLKDYSKMLVKKFDNNGDGLISFQELCDGLRRMHILLSSKEQSLLMAKLDLNDDGEITEDEIYKALASVDKRAPFPKYIVNSSIEDSIAKLLQGADNFSSMREYARHLVRQFDGNRDGKISFQELVDGLRSMNIYMNSSDLHILMKRLDINRDGTISEDEMLQLLQSTESDAIQPTLLPQVVEQVLKKIASGADDFNNMKGYAKQLMKRFDRNNDGIISFKELCDGLRNMGINLTQREREALMRKLDTNQDGNISEQELAKALSTINVENLRQLANESADVALKKIVAGSESYPSVREYCKYLMKRFDGNGDGLLSFEELFNGLKSIHIQLNLREKLALMKRLDLNKDGEITIDELYKTLSKVDAKLNKTQLQNSLDQVLRRIAGGADEFSSLKEYVRYLIKKFDKNSDGMISLDELASGLQTLDIQINNQEKSALMRHLDFNNDGEISQEEILKALKPYDDRASSIPQIKSSNNWSSTIGPDKVSFQQKERERIAIDDIIAKVKKGASKYQSFKHFVTALMRRYDTDGDGYLNFKEISEGLAYDNIKLTHEEKLAFMKYLDTDCDGAISKDELFDALLLDQRHRRNHHVPKVNIDHLLKRIRQGAEKFKSLDDFVRFIFDKMDTDGSGTLSFNELSVGLNNMGIDISQKEKHALMQKLDDDADGEIAYDEFYRGLASVGKFKQPSEINQSQQINIDHALIKIVRGAEQYKCLEDYIIVLFRKFDINKDGALSFKELREGLNSLNVHLSDNEIHALFHHIDVDRDGEITQEELYNACLSKEKYTQSSKVNHQKVNIDHVLNIIKKGVEKYSSLKEYVDALMERFDINGDGSISIDELDEGLKSINVRISGKEKLALMKELDKDRDGGISKQELYNALASSSGKMNFMPGKQASGLNKGSYQTGVDQIIAKIRKSVSHYKSMQEQIIGLLRIFDLDNDGLISFLELVDGVKALGIQAKKSDMIDLMNRIDVDKDGFITQIELYKALDLKATHKEYQGTSVSIEQVLTKLRRGAEKYRDLGEYVDVLFQMFATAGSKFMTFNELMNCLKTFNFNLQHVEKIALMKKMDENGDNQISKEEFYHALAQAGQPGGSRTFKGDDRSSDPRDNADVRVEQALLKIKQGASQFKNLQDYCLALVRKLDTNKDGHISSVELVNGLRDMFGIKLYKGEIAAIMKRIDEDQDNMITYDELYKALSRVHG